VAQDTATKAAKPAVSSGFMRELFLALLWFGTSMYSARAALTGSEDLSGPLLAAASALPGVVAATIVSGATLGAAAGSRFGNAFMRLLAGLGVGVLFGVAAAVGVRYAYGNAQSITVLAVVVGAASVLGGAAAILPNDIVEAALWGATWVFFAGVIFGVLQPNIIKTVSETQFVYGQSLLTGLIGGIYAYRNLRNEKWAHLWFLLAGALPGLILLASEYLTRLGGSSLVKLVHGFTADNAALVQLSDTARLRHALIVTAVGGVSALIAGSFARSRIIREEREERERDEREAREEREREEREAREYS
jgi:hypothetical protein